MSLEKTSAEQLFDIRVFLGSIRIVETHGRAENGDFLLGGYSITYDEHGREVSRTENRWNVRITVS